VAFFILNFIYYVPNPRRWRGVWRTHWVHHW